MQSVLRSNAIDLSNASGWSGEVQFRMACFGKIHGMTSLPNLDQITADQLRVFGAQLMSQVETMGNTVETMTKTVETLSEKINRDQKVIEKLSHEIAQLKRLKFAKRSEQINPGQAGLLDDLNDTDIAAVETKRWAALSRYLDYGAVPIDNNWQRTRSGHGFLVARTGSLQVHYAAAKRAAAIKSRFQSARLMVMIRTPILRMFSYACRQSGRVKSSSCFRISNSRFNHARHDARTHTVTSSDSINLERSSFFRLTQFRWRDCRRQHVNFS